MCRLYTLKTNPRTLAEIFGVEFPALPGELFKTTHKVVAVRQRDGLKEAAIFHWGLIPPWAKDKKEGSSRVNARAETVAEKNSYRVPFKRKRCLMPASAFYDYKKIGAQREPHLFTVPDQPTFAFAGLWESCQLPDGEVVESCSMMTCEPNSLVTQFHDRMPVILPPHVWDHWLSSTEDVDELKPLLVSYPSELMNEELVDSPLKKPKPESKQKSLFS